MTSYLFFVNMESFSSENLINLVHNESLLWDPTVNASEEDKDLAWKKIADKFGINSGNCHGFKTLVDSLPT